MTPSNPSPGVHIERRSLLRFGLAAMATAPLTGLWGCATSAASNASRTSDDPIALGTLVAMVRARARTLVTSERPDEDRYLDYVASLLPRLDSEPPWRLRPIGDKKFSMNTSAYVPPITVLDIHMEPGAKIALHDHKDYNGVLHCTKGFVQCRNFDFVEPKSQLTKGEDFLICQTKNVQLETGMTSALSRTRNNIHEVVAGPKGCTLVDVFTFFEKGGQSRNIEWDDTPLEAGSNVYRVAWKA